MAKEEETVRKLGRDKIKHELQEGRGKIQIHGLAKGTREGKSGIGREAEGIIINRN